MNLGLMIFDEAPEFPTLKENQSYSLMAKILVAVMMRRTEALIKQKFRQKIRRRKYYFISNGARPAAIS
jgi:hypothetical protein